MKEQLDFESKEDEKIYDFYFSAEQNEIIHSIAIPGEFETFTTRRPFFKGKEYTEAVEKGKKPTGNFSDYELVGTGKMKDVSER